MEAVYLWEVSINRKFFKPKQKKKALNYEMILISLRKMFKK